MSGTPISETPKKETPKKLPVALPSLPVQDKLGEMKISLSILHSSLTYNKKAQNKEEGFLGKGGFGKVYKGLWNYEDVAIKVLTNKKFTENALKEFKQEAEIMAKMRSNYIVQLRGLCESPYCLVMEYMPKGSLYDLLHNGQEIPWAIRFRIALDVAYGLALLHEVRILHRDLKSLNILLDDRLRAKLADFGLSHMKLETRTISSNQRSVGTLAWMPPELFKRGAQYTLQSDMYSYGMVLWELAVRKVPFADAHTPEVLKDWLKEGEKETVPEDVAENYPGFAKLIQDCWQTVGKRPSAEEAAKALEGLYQAEAKAKGAVSPVSFPAEALAPSGSSEGTKAPQSGIPLALDRVSLTDRGSVEVDPMEALRKKKEALMREHELEALEQEVKALERKAEEKRQRKKAEEEQERLAAEKRQAKEQTRIKKEQEEAQRKAKEASAEKLKAEQAEARQRELEQKKKVVEEKLIKSPTSLPLSSIGKDSPILSVAKPSAFVDAKTVELFLKHVVEGEQDKAEELLKKNAGLALQKGSVTDLSKREFKNITGFQYAVWALDWHMWRMLLKYLGEEAAGEQLREWDQLGTYSHGKHATWQGLIDAYAAYYPNNYTSEYWVKQIGGGQLLLPAHVANEYCHGSRAFYPLPDFGSGTVELTRSRLSGGVDWYDGRCGVEWGHTRAEGDGPTPAGDTTARCSWCDRVAVAALLETRLRQRADLVKTLTATLSVRP